MIKRIEVRCTLTDFSITLPGYVVIVDIINKFILQIMENVKCK